MKAPLRRVPPLALLLAALAEPPAAAAVLAGEVEHEDGRYRVHFTARLEADPDFLRERLTDYANFHRLSDALIESRVLSQSPDGRRARVRFVFEACVLFFCRRFLKTAQIETEGATVVMHADPRASDFRHAEERWQVTRADGGSLVRYEAQFVPDFFVPPLIGPWLIKSRIRHELETTARRLEEEAIERRRR